MTEQENIRQVLADPKVQAKPKLSQLFSVALTRLDTEQASQVMPSLMYDISLYLTLNHYTAPKSVLDFAQTYQKTYHQARGIGSALRMLAQSLTSLK
ncbi:bacteriocin immunity protein [Streptococcus cuniculipharyngis]|nr:bacteriocin immunity protein [Streptococcus cuniculipharyngis]